MPLQMMVALDAVQRGHQYPAAAKDVNFNPVGQVVGMMNRVERSAEVVQRLGRAFSLDELLAGARLTAGHSRSRPQGTLDSGPSRSGSTPASPDESSPSSR